MEFFFFFQRLASICMWSSAAGAGAHLMGSADEVQVVTVEELADDVGSEREGDAAVVLSPALHVFVRVRPQQVAQEACRRGGGGQDGDVNATAGQTRPRQALRNIARKCTDTASVCCPLLE